MSKPLRAVAVLVCLAASLRAQEKAQAAIPGITSAPLFTIGWNLTANYVRYDARLKDGAFDPKQSVIAYWVMNQTDGHHEPLTLIERLRGYGFTIRPGSAPDTYDMVIVSVKKKTLHIARNGGQIPNQFANQFNVTMSIANCETAYLNQVQVQAHRWHFLAIADYADLIGTDVKTGGECRERVRQE